MTSQGLDADMAVFPELINTSLSDRARGEILKAILDGRFSERLPAEDELARMLNVSRTTIRSALQGLEQEGIITRRRAIGTTINRHVGPATLALQRLIGFDWLLKEAGHEVTVESSFERRTTPPEFAKTFDIKPDEPCFCTSKLFMADGAAALEVRDVVPIKYLRDVALDDDAPVSMFEFSKRYLVDPIDHAVVEVVPMVMRKGVSALGVKNGKAFTRLHETHYTSSASAVACSIINVDDDYIRFEVFRREST